MEALEAVESGRPVADALARATHGLAKGEDRKLATHLVYGTLRHRRLLDYWIAPFARGPLEPQVRNILRLAFLQKAFLDRVPDYAIVFAAVEQAKRVKPQAQGLINAILRRGLNQTPMPADPAVRYSHPDWVVNRWRARWPEDLEDLLRQSNEIPPLTLRVSGQTDREALLKDLARRGIAAEPSPWVPMAIRVWGSLWLEDWPPFQEGRVAVQDESSMLVSLVLDAASQSRVLDLAAGVGGKSIAVLDLMGEGHVTAVDTNGERLAKLVQNADRLGLSSRISVVRGDARALTSRLQSRFDRVMLDAPCTGLGVLRRRVDARWKKHPDDVDRLSTLQCELLDVAAGALTPGGVLVYSVCSTEPEETEKPIQHVLARHPELRLAPVSPHLPSPDLRRMAAGPTWMMRPGQRWGMDGFFMARLTKSPDREGI